MFYNKETKLRGETSYAERPQLTSYDSSHEHSIEHFIEVRLMVEEFEEKTTTGAETRELVEMI